MDATATRMTAEQYYEITVEGDRKQLVEGEVVVNEPKAIHMHLQGTIYLALRAWTEAGANRGFASLPTDVRVNEHNVYGPDVIWFSDARFREAFPSGLDAYPVRLPDLCVEIRSESTWRYDIGAKKRVYEAAGLQELWLVDNASETVLVYRRTKPQSRTFDETLELGAGETLTSSLLPGFELPLSALFAR